MIISPDAHLYTPEGTYVWTGERCREARHQANKELWGAMKSGKYKKVVLLCGLPGSGKSTWVSANYSDDCIYFDATSPSKKSRKYYVMAAKECNIPIEALWMDTPLEVCLARNALRTPDRKVPEEKILEMSKKLRQSPPTNGEFSAVHRITLNSGSFGPV